MHVYAYVYVYVGCSREGPGVLQYTQYIIRNCKIIGTTRAQEYESTKVDEYKGTSVWEYTIKRVQERQQLQPLPDTYSPDSCRWDLDITHSTSLSGLF